MSRRAADPADREGLTSGDRLRYGLLLVLGSLVWLGVLGDREGGVAGLVAVWLLLVAGGLWLARARKERS